LSELCQWTTLLIFCILLARISHILFLLRKHRQVFVYHCVNGIPLCQDSIDKMKVKIYLEFCYASNIVVPDNCYLENLDSLTAWDQCAFRDNVSIVYICISYNIVDISEISQILHGLHFLIYEILCFISKITLWYI